MAASAPVSIKNLMKFAAFFFVLLAAEICTCRAQEKLEWETQLHASLNMMAERLTSRFTPWVVPNRVFRVEDFGAVADGKTLNTSAINSTIDACSSQGGGVVQFSNGDYVSGTVVLKSGVMLEVAAGSRLLGSTNLADFPVSRTVTDPEHKQALIFAEGRERIGIRGPGEIGGRGPFDPLTEDPRPVNWEPAPWRPYLIHLVDSKKVVIDGITLKDSGLWQMQDYANCDEITLQGITVANPSREKCDGINIDGCRNVIVRNCLVYSEGRGLFFHGLTTKPTENVLVENSKFFGTGPMLQYGPSSGIFRNVLIRNVEIGGSTEDMPSWRKWPAFTGISWEVAEGGLLENVIVSNVHMVRTKKPFRLMTLDSPRRRPEMPKPKPPIIRHAVLENIRGETLGCPSEIWCMENLVVRGIRISLRGTDLKESADSYGFKVVNGHDVHFIDVQITPESFDTRPCFWVFGSSKAVTLNGKPLRESPR